MKLGILPLRWFLKARTTVLLLVVLSVFLLLGVVLPQEAVLGDEDFANLLEDSGPVLRVVLDKLGLGRMATSPVFLGVMGLFFLNLAAVLLSRLAPTLRRITLGTRSEAGLQAWARMEERFEARLPLGWSPGTVARVLRGFGYQVRRPGDRTFWGVKHRTAPLGFLLFHMSFFLLCAGGVLIYYTRFVGDAVLIEGQDFQGNYQQIHRSPPVGDPPSLALTLERVDARFEGAEPVHLAAVFRFWQGASTFQAESRVNHPAKWATSSLLVQRAGLAPVLWLQDDDGFTLDRVASPARTRSGPPSEIPLDAGRVQVLVHPLPVETPFPGREELMSTPIRIQVLRGKKVVFDDELRPSQAAELQPGRLVLEELRYWVGFQVISERGGGWLIAGFVLGIVGLVWRLLWHRREVAVTWDEEEFRVVGRSEYFSDRFRHELSSLFEMLMCAESPEQSVERPAES